MDNHTKNVQNHEDSDSGISLDDLQCCICKLGDATDENDLLLCDGQGCCRAFHMACVWPAITLDDLEGKETENWFCPLCQALPNLLAEIQESCMDEEWVYRKEQSRIKRGKQNSKHKRNKDDDSKNAESTSSSLQSWNGAIDVFPEAEWQMNASKLLKMSPQQQQQQQQQSTDDIAHLLETYLGPDFLPARSHDPTAVSLLPMGSDSEDENDYSLFDEASFEERKRRRRLEEKKKRKITNSATQDNDDNDDDDDDDDENEEATSSSPSSTQSSKTNWKHCPTVVVMTTTTMTMRLHRHPCRRPRWTTIAESASASAKRRDGMIVPATRVVVIVVIVEMRRPLRIWPISMRRISSMESGDARLSTTVN
jgi:PHD-finger